MGSRSSNTSVQVRIVYMPMGFYLKTIDTPSRVQTYAPAHLGEDTQAVSSEKCNGLNDDGLTAMGMTVEDLIYMANEEFSPNRRPAEEGLGLANRTVYVRDRVVEAICRVLRGTSCIPLFKSHLLTEHGWWTPVADAKWTDSPSGIAYLGGDWTPLSAKLTNPSVVLARPFLSSRSTRTRIFRSELF